MARFAGRVAIVTGAGAPDGIGAAVARHLVDEGAKVVLGATTDRVHARAAEFGESGVAVVGDLTAEGSAEALVAAAVDRWGRVDVLVNNAMWVRYGEIQDISQDMLQRMVGTGFFSVVWGMQVAAEFMTKGGSVINVASAAAFLGIPKAMIYCGVKSGVLGLTRSAAVDFGPRGIRVNAVAPGSVPTEGVGVNVDAAMVEKRIAKTPMRRLGTVEDIASAVCYLASAESAWVTGECIKVDGGVTHAFL